MAASSLPLSARNSSGRSGLMKSWSKVWKLAPLALDSLKIDEAGGIKIWFGVLKPGSYDIKIPGNTGETQRLDITIK